jgi:sugar phosphate permease
MQPGYIVGLALAVIVVLAVAEFAPEAVNWVLLLILVGMVIMRPQVVTLVQTMGASVQKLSGGKSQ